MASATGPGARQHSSSAAHAPAISPSSTSRPAWSLTAWLVILSAVSLALLGGTLGWRLRRRWDHVRAPTSVSVAEHALTGDAEVELERSPIFLP